MAGEKDLQLLLKNMEPSLQTGRFVFCTLPTGSLPADVQIIASFREVEGLTVVVEQDSADQQGWTYEGAMAWITLRVYSALEAVGLTAAVAAALAKEEISCNVIAAYYHDHLFVPIEQGQAALATLQQLSKQNQRG